MEPLGMMTGCETQLGYNCTKTGPKMDKVSRPSDLIGELYFSLDVNTDDAIPKSSSSDRAPQR
jgi:hypothetical protein